MTRVAGERGAKPKNAAEGSADVARPWASALRGGSWSAEWMSCVVLCCWAPGGEGGEAGGALNHPNSGREGGQELV